MARAETGPLGLFLRSIYRFQSIAHVRVAEVAFLVVYLGGFYLISVLTVFDPFLGGIGSEILSSIPVTVQIAATVIVPFGILLLEWLAAIGQLRSMDEYPTWDTKTRLLVFLEITVKVRTIPILIYVPLLPAALFWAIIGWSRGNPLWPAAAAIFVVDAIAVIAANRYLNTRDQFESITHRLFERLFDFRDR